MTPFKTFLACVPPTTTHQRKKIGRGGGKFAKLVETPELEAAKATLDALLLMVRPPLPGDGSPIVPGMVTLRLQYTWPWREKDGKKLRAQGWTYKGTKPDCSNLAKTIEDRLAALRFIASDENVVKLHVEKRFGDTPGIAVEITPIGLDFLPY